MLLLESAAKTATTTTTTSAALPATATTPIAAAALAAATTTTAAGVNVQITAKGVAREQAAVNDQLPAAASVNYAAYVAHLNGFNPKHNSSSSNHNNNNYISPPHTPTQQLKQSNNAFESLLRQPQIQVKQEFMELMEHNSNNNNHLGESDKIYTVYLNIKYILKKYIETI